MIYFDNAATTKPDKGLLETYLKNNESCFGNPSSRHSFGREANKILEKGREGILSDLNLSSTHRVIFLSGASEGNNLAIKGIARNYSNRGKRIITSQVEHPSILETFKVLEKEGFEVIYLPVNSLGEVELSSLEKAMNRETILVSIMAVNNETGSINDIASLAKIVHQYPKCFFHVDVTQGIGKMELPYKDIDLFSFSGHKIHGLKGTGALIAKKNITLHREIDGGDQEYFFRAGTVDVYGAYSLYEALHLSLKKMKENQRAVKEIASYLREELSKINEVEINSPLNSSPYILNFSFKHKKASVITEALSHEEIYVSSVSACNSKGEPISYVLEAMGKDKGNAMNSIRLSFSYENTLEEAKIFIETLKDIIERIIDR